MDSCCRPISWCLPGPEGPYKWNSRLHGLRIPFLCTVLKENVSREIHNKDKYHFCSNLKKFIKKKHLVVRRFLSPLGDQVLQYCRMSYFDVTVLRHCHTIMSSSNSIEKKFLD